MKRMQYGKKSDAMKFKKEDMKQDKKLIAKMKKKKK